jgi:carboxymethylenebutenolidase
MVAQITGAREGHESFIYEDAGHGFNCDERDDYRPDTAALALERTLAFLDQHLGGS